MNHLELSAITKKLLATAKTDVPSSAARAQVWAGVSGVVGGAAAAGASGAAASAVLTGGAGATKLVAIGALFGGALTVGLATALLQIGVAKAPQTVASHALGSPAIASHALGSPAPASTATTLNPGAAGPRLSPFALPSPVEPVSAVLVESAPPADVDSPGAAATPATSPVRAPIGHAHRHAKVRDDSLAREASLVAEARGALAVGDPRSALRAIREARALPSKQLVPEELAVEEQALRALGRNDEANGIDVMLRLQYPESALAP